MFSRKLLNAKQNSSKEQTKHNDTFTSSLPQHTTPSRPHGTGHRNKTPAYPAQQPGPKVKLELPNSDGDPAATCTTKPIKPTNQS